MKNLKPDLKLKSGGPVAEMIARLLSDATLSHEDVARRVREGNPRARTSARSVASIATALRRDGYRVPDRQRHRAA
jgi:hypothetical protein